MRDTLAIAIIIGSIVIFCISIYIENYMAAIGWLLVIKYETIDLISRFIDKNQ